MDNELELKLIFCLDALDAGEPINQILARYPADAAALRPMLETAVALPSLSLVPSTSAQFTSRRAFLNRAADMRPTAGRRFLGLPLRMGLILATTMLAVMIAGGGTVAASAAALPGDPLYRIKRVAEQVRITLASDKVSVVQEIAQRRRDEISALISKNRSADVEFSGTVVRVSKSSLQVANLVVEIDANTQMDAAISVGAIVTIIGRLDGETIHATRIVLGGVPASSTAPIPTATTEIRATATTAPSATYTPEPTLMNTLKPTFTSVPEPMDATALPITEPAVTRTERPRSNVQATSTPSLRPTSVPNPTAEPPTRALLPTAKPTDNHDGHSTTVPTAKSTIRPTDDHASHSTSVPTDDHTSHSTSVPTAESTDVPTAEPTDVPARRVPTTEPTDAPTSVPTVEPTDVPTGVPTTKPTNVPTSVPTAEPTNVPTSVPTAEPTDVPTSVPTTKPTNVPTSVPTAEPTDNHESHNTSVPTSVPTEGHENRSTAAPTSAPTAVPTDAPTSAPTAAPTDAPTSAPTAAPTDAPTSAPTAAPTDNHESHSTPVPTAARTDEHHNDPTPTPANDHGDHSGR